MQGNSNNEFQYSILQSSAADLSLYTSSLEHIYTNSESWRKLKDTTQRGLEIPIEQSWGYKSSAAYNKNSNSNKKLLFLLYFPQNNFKSFAFFLKKQKQLD